MITSFSMLTYTLYFVKYWCLRLKIKMNGFKKIFVMDPNLIDQDYVEKMNQPCVAIDKKESCVAEPVVCIPAVPKKRNTKKF